MTARAADYRSIVADVRQRHDVRIKRWRRNMTGCAWRVDYHDGRAINWVEAPYPKSPISLAIFLHEVGHHAIGFATYRLRCEEEYHAWNWALAEMRRIGVAPDAKVRRRAELSMRYAVDKAMRRGLKQLPVALQRYAPEPVTLAA
jgi:hypothetical protein